MSQRLVPKLRFPEFRGDEGWEVHPLGDKSSIVRGGSPRPIEDFLTSSSTGLNWLKIGDVSPESKYVTQTSEKVIPEALNKTRQVAPGDLILSNSMSFGRPYILQIDSCIHDGWIAVTETVDIVETDYLYYAILSPSSQLFFLENAAGAVVQNLNAEIVKKLRIPIPGRAEQSKIAACLSSLDDLMAAHQKKLETLRVHKKGLMQQLFPIEGETMPQLRFPEFRGEWVAKKLWELVEKVSLPVEVSDEVVYREIGIRSHGKGIFHKEPVSGLMLGEKRVFWVVPGTLIVNIVFAWEQAVAVVGPIEAGMIASHRFPMYKSVSGNCHIPYLKHFLLTLRGKTLLGLASPGGAGRNKTLGQKEFEELVLLIPTDLREQEKIASLLTSVDDQIRSQSQLIETLKQQKEALMQQLFPHLEDSGE